MNIETPQLRTRVTDHRVDALNPSGWGRGRLLLVLMAVAGTVTLMVCGLAYALMLGLSDGSQSARPRLTTAKEGGAFDAPVTTTAKGRQHRDAIASEPMMTVTPQDMRPTSPAGVAAPTIAVPAPTRAGRVGVPTGFPRTPTGAVGQLAAIETTVLQGMSIPLVSQVYDAWVLPGEPGGAVDWELTVNVQAFLEATGATGQEKDLTTTVVATPSAGLVKGTDGPDWTLACVLLAVRATVTTDARIGYGHCAAMEWVATSATDGTWMVDATAPVARAPSTWPGSERAVAAGWRTWRWSRQSDTKVDTDSDTHSDTFLSSGAGE